MFRRILTAILALSLFAAGCWYAVDSTRLVAFEQGGDVYTLLFDRFAWLVWLAPFAGLVVSGYTGRQAARIERGRVLRHDGAAIVEHWTHAAGTVLLLATGAALGFLMVPRVLTDVISVGVAMNLHFIGALWFLFGSFFYLGNGWHSRRIAEHLPRSIVRSVIGVFERYRAVLLRSAPPEEGKYFHAEHLSYPVMALSCATLIVSGFAKLVAHGFTLPSDVAAAITLAHDGAAIALAAFLAAHIVLGALVPWSWPLLASMVTGTVGEEYAKRHHSAWYRSVAGSTEAPDA